VIGRVEVWRHHLWRIWTTDSGDLTWISVVVAEVVGFFMNRGVPVSIIREFLFAKKKIAKRSLMRCGTCIRRVCCICILYGTSGTSYYLLICNDNVLLRRYMQVILRVLVHALYLEAVQLSTSILGSAKVRRM
jgi:hypothetical protein